jgi:RHH-type proline utilization regulon transcriptional repressor/proline dehydrogenase/delta 1-pyrroline-5-carboxylate dehydrogenase
VIDAEAKARARRHLARCAGRRTVWQRELPPAASAALSSPGDRRDRFDRRPAPRELRPVLHVARFAAGRARAGDRGHQRHRLRPHARPAQPHRRHPPPVESRARAGNFYVNRNQIGAVVGSQPFGGEGLSGTGPKAGGPNYVVRFATERVTTIDTTAAGGNASLLAGG